MVRARALSPFSKRVEWCPAGFSRKYANPTSAPVMALDIERFPSIGIVSEDGAGLDGWMITREDGSIGVLHVSDRCRRKGYGRALVQAMLVRQATSPLSALACAGTVEGPGGNSGAIGLSRAPFCYTARWNAASASLFKGLGFTRCGGANWLWPVRLCKWSSASLWLVSSS